jgi:hypothetical protein
MQSFSRSDLYNMGREEAAAEALGPRATFFLTLCQVVAPVSVPESKSPALQRFRFFFTRDTEAGHSRYWLHFGYFDTELEAKRWRGVLGRIYPRATIQSSHRSSADQTTSTQTALTDTQVLKMLTAEAAMERTATQARPPAPASAPKAGSKALTASLNALRDDEWAGLKEDDTTIRSGIRHLHVELVASARSRKDLRTKRKP